MSEQTPRGRATSIRALPPAVEFRSAADDSDIGPGFLGRIRIRFSPVNEWTEINSSWEGNFLERFAPGAWTKTISERAERIKALFQHGADPQIGDKPLGPFHRLEEDDDGGYAEVDLLDTSYNRDLQPGLKAGLYGASHRFMVIRETVDEEPEASEYNPRGLTEHTITEARLYELGPVTFPAYPGATAGMRSMTDEFLISCFRSDPDRLREMFDRAVTLDRRPTEVAGQEPNQQHQQASERTDAAPDDTPADDAGAVAGSTSPTDRRQRGYGLANDDQSRPSWAL